jgi:hypothetical protein
MPKGNGNATVAKVAASKAKEPVVLFFQKEKNTPNCQLFKAERLDTGTQHDWFGSMYVPKDVPDGSVLRVTVEAVPLKSLLK